MRGSIRKVVRILRRGHLVECGYRPNLVLLECGHKGPSWGRKAAYCHKCHEISVAKQMKALEERREQMKKKHFKKPPLIPVRMVDEVLLKNPVGHVVARLSLKQAWKLSEDINLLSTEK